MKKLLSVSGIAAAVLGASVSAQAAGISWPKTNAAFNELESAAVLQNAGFELTTAPAAPEAGPVATAPQAPQPPQVSDADKVALTAIIREAAGGKTIAEEKYKEALAIIERNWNNENYAKFRAFVDFRKTTLLAQALAQNAKLPAEEQEKPEAIQKRADDWADNLFSGEIKKVGSWKFILAVAAGKATQAATELSSEEIDSIEAVVAASVAGKPVDAAKKTAALAAIARVSSAGAILKAAEAQREEIKTQLEAAAKQIVEAISKNQQLQQLIEQAKKNPQIAQFYAQFDPNFPAMVRLWGATPEETKAFIEELVTNSIRQAGIKKAGDLEIHKYKVEQARSK